MDGVPGTDPGTPSGLPTGLPSFVTLTSGSASDPAADIPSSGRILGQLLLIAVALVLLVTVGATVATSRLAEHEAINDAANTADLLARSVVTPALTDPIVDADPAAIASLDQAVRRSVLPNNIVRVKIWRPDGTVVYADDHRLIGRTFVLDVEQQETLSSPQTRAEVSDLSRAENEFERFQGRLLEVYRPVWTPGGHQLMFEVYGDYAPVEARAAELRRGLAGLLVSTVLVLVTLMAPLLWRLVTRLRSASRQREALLQRAVDASDEERRRIAVNLHDGPVQELVASAYAVAGAAERADSRGEAEVARAVRAAEGSVRGTVGSLRSLLVDLYPASLAAAGLTQAVTDLAAPLRSRGIDVEVSVPEGLAETLDPVDQRLIYRTARECLRNVATHSQAGWAQVSVRPEPDQVVLDVVDDGVGFDVPATLRALEAGHLGLRSLIDTAHSRGATLEVASAPDAGTHWRLAVPLRTGGPTP